MHIYVMGGTGRNGSLVIKTALARGHTVTALVRNPDSVESHPSLTLVKGTPSSEADVKKALTSPQAPAAVISALSARRTTDSPFSPLAPDSPLDFLTATMRTLLSAVASLSLPQPPKIVVNSAQGTGSSWPSMIFPMRAIMRHTNMKFSRDDHENLDALVRSSGLPFVMARPGRLLEGPAEEVKVWPDNGKGAPWMAAITRESVANWLVDAAQGNEWDGKSPVLTK